MRMSSRRNWLCIVGVVAILGGCAQPVSKTAQGTLAGAALGAGTGAIIGSATGKAGVGTAIGAGIGALGGALTGHAMDRMDEERAETEAQLRRNQEQIDENSKLIDELRKRGADARGSKRGVVVNLPDILFQFDRAELTREAERTISEISEVLKDVRDRPLSIEGHTDSVGNVKYNKQLSEKRAESVASKLSRDGISRQRMTVQGYGEGKPIATNNSEEGRARNRRVEIIIEN